MKNFKVKLNLILFLFVGLVVWSCKSENVQQKEVEAVTSTESDRTILLEDLDGNPINLDDYKGKKIFLNFWATWCKPCIAEMPSIERASIALEGDNFVFLAASDEKMEKVKKFAEKYPYNFKYVRMKNNAISMGLTVLPTTYIFNEEGEVVEKIVGAREWDSDDELASLRNF